MDRTNNTPEVIAMLEHPFGRILAQTLLVLCRGLQTLIATIIVRFFFHFSSYESSHTLAGPRRNPSPSIQGRSKGPSLDEGRGAPRRG